MSELEVFIAKGSDGIIHMAKALTRSQARVILCEESDELYADPRVKRVPWLDCFTNPKGADGTMAEARHDWPMNVIVLEDMGVEPKGELVHDYGMFSPIMTFGDDESRWELFARLIGARYPDRYKPREEES